MFLLAADAARRVRDGLSAVRGDLLPAVDAVGGARLMPLGDPGGKMGRDCDLTILFVVLLCTIDDVSHHRHLSLVPDYFCTAVFFSSRRI
ncbi:MAG: hypothetical protein M0P74_00865 [Syntrophales bacterium]|nr:hypothetical protein [Syntrophales bacterium]